MLTTSEPAFGALIASAPPYSPVTSLGRYLSFCAGVPLRWIWFTARLECAPYESPTEPEAREISSIATICARYPMFEPPNSSSAVMPSTPSLPNLRHRSMGKVLSRSMSAARGAISRAANACTLSRSMSMSCPRLKLSEGKFFMKDSPGFIGLASRALSSGFAAASRTASRDRP